MKQLVYLTIVSQIFNMFEKIDPVLLSPLTRASNKNKGKRGGIHFSALPVNLYENQNIMLEALKKKDLTKILKGFFSLFYKLTKNKLVFKNY